MWGWKTDRSRVLEAPLTDHEPKEAAMIDRMILIALMRLRSEARA